MGAMGLIYPSPGANAGYKFLPTAASQIEYDLAILEGHTHLQSGGPGTNGTIGAPIVQVTAIQSASGLVTPQTPIYILLINTGANVTVNLPPAGGVLGATNGYRLTVKDATGTANVHNITITPNGADKIDTVNASVTIAAAFGSLSLVSDGSSNWYKV